MTPSELLAIEERAEKATPGQRLVDGSRRGQANRFKPLSERFWLMVEKSEGCWTWRGNRMGANGRYGCVTVRRERRLVHRVAWELLRGPIPDGLTIDHLCGNKLCVNPDHLEPVTQSENTRRSNALLRKPHCPQGHLFDEANTWRDKHGKRHCRACGRNRKRQANARARAALSSTGPKEGGEGR